MTRAAWGVAAILGSWLAFAPGALRGDDAAGLVGHWPLSADTRDHSKFDRPTRSQGVQLGAAGPRGVAATAATFDGIDDSLEVPATHAPRLGTGDFTVATWVYLPEHLTGQGMDLVSAYDSRRHRGWQLSVKSHASTGSQANRRNLHFGLAGGQAEQPWTDHGRLGNAIMVFALAVYRGQLFAGTCEPGAQQSGHVYALGPDGKWTDCGSPAPCNSVSALAVFNGQLYAGVSKYRLAGSALTESENPNLGGKVFRYDGAQRWVDCGQLPETEAVGGLVVFQGKLYAGSLYRPAGFFRYEGGNQWTRLETFDGKRVEALCVHRGQLWASSYDGAHIYRYDGQKWVDLGQVGDETNTQTYSFAAYQGELYVGTWRSGKVFRFQNANQWVDRGRLGEELEVMGMLVHNGRLYAGSLPLAHVFRYDGDERWTSVGQVDATPMVTYRRAWTMAEYRGRLYVGTLPTGKVWSTTNGVSVTHDDELAAGWRHVAAVRAGSKLKLFVDGRAVAESVEFQPADYDVSAEAFLRIGFGQNDYLDGRLSDVRVYDRALEPSVIARLAQP